MNPRAVVDELLEEALRKNRVLQIYATGESMRPFIRPRDPIWIASCSFEDIKPGDILFMKRENGFRIHRFYRYDFAEKGFPPRLITKGDAIREFDPPCEAHAVLAKVVACGTGIRKWVWQFLNWGKGLYVRINWTLP